MGTQFEDFASSGVDDFFGATPGNFGTDQNNDEGVDDDDNDGDDEIELIKDGNAQVLKNFEARRKSGDYARSQTSRQKKAPTLNMASVDWSGFPGAAHKNKPLLSGERKPRTSASRRSSLLGSVASLDHDDPKGFSGSASASNLSPKVSSRKYRSRRHFLKTGGGLPEAAADIGEADDGGPKRMKSLPVASSRQGANERPKRHGSVGQNDSSRPRLKGGLGQNDNSRPKLKGSLSGVSGPKTRSERRSAESKQRLNRRPSKVSSDQPKRRSKSRTRVPQTMEQKRSLSPSKQSVLRTHSSSPSGRIRRPVSVAAAASTTLEVSKITDRRRISRSQSRGKRKTSQNVDEEVFKKAESFRW